MSDVGYRRSRIDHKAAVLAGLIAGALFVVLEMAMVAMFLGGSPWGPPRMIAAIAMGPGVLPPPATFEPTVMMVAMLIHLGLAVALAYLFALVVGRQSTAMAVLVGLVFGLIVYAINFYGMTTVFPWFQQGRHWVSIFAHAVFGMVLGGLYSERTLPVR
ncbi:MAG: hypothetical protein M3Q40_09595 [Pseudomonadota bacterium]|nr:hypothetical protein [Pseudomonadota bacterium]